MCWPLLGSVVFTRSLCHQKEPRGNMSCGCRELGCVGHASVCLSVHLCQGARSVGGLCSLWVCTLGLGGVEGGHGRGE